MRLRSSSAILFTAMIAASCAKGIAPSAVDTQAAHAPAAAAVDAELNNPASSVANDSSVDTVGLNGTDAALGSDAILTPDTSAVTVPVAATTPTVPLDTVAPQTSLAEPTSETIVAITTLAPPPITDPTTTTPRVVPPARPATTLAAARKTPPATGEFEVTVQDVARQAAELLTTKVLYIDELSITPITCDGETDNYSAQVALRITQPSRVLRRRTQFGYGYRDEALVGNNTIVSTTDACGRTLSAASVDALVAGKTPATGARVTGSLPTTTPYLKIAGQTSAIPTANETKLIELLRSMSSASDLMFNNESTDDPWQHITWTDGSGAHKMELALQPTSISSLTSNELDTNTVYGFGRTLDGLKTDGSDFPATAPLVNEAAYRRSIDPTIPAATPKSAKISTPSAFNPALPKPTAGTPIDVGNRTALYVEYGRGLESVKLTVEDNGRVLVTQGFGESSSHRPFAWVIPQNVVAELVAETGLQKPSPFPQDQQMGKEPWARVSLGSTNWVGMGDINNTNDALRYKFASYVAKLTSKILTQRIGDARYAAPATIFAQYRGPEPARNRGAVTTTPWLLSRPMEEVFSPDATCVQFTGNDAILLWSELKKWNSDSIDSIFVNGNDQLWDVQFRLYWTKLEGASCG
jgi:hypothetical protein